MTERLFDENSYLTAFEATVTACRKTENGYAVILDRTAFFPEGGGQKGDEGFLNALPVHDTQETSDGEIEHYIDAPLAVGERVSGRIDGEVRFARMQNHTAEHIFSGHVFRAFGLKNVGFHLGDGYMTVDYDGALTKSDICLIEQMTMKTVFAALPVKAWFRQHPEAYEYRSKKELTGRIRLVEIPGVDLCACCAPHLHTTAEVGCVKVLSCERYKGGVRLTMTAGAWAMREFTMAWDTVMHLSALFSLPPQEVAHGADQLAQKLKESEDALKQARREDVLRLVRESTEPFVFVPDAS
ncbi:MAG: alanyl-tRNA editing protein, partial [Clostridia bacterium]|nr:alanyl-tRNA editing protein [Clostridia bacterium]